MRYIDTDTGEHLADHVGRCNREDKCGYHYKPRDYFRDNPDESHKHWQPGRGFFPRGKSTRQVNRHRSTLPVNPLLDNLGGYFISFNKFNASLKHYEHNNFVSWLESRYGIDRAYQAVARYRIGTSKHWPGATIFWQVDADGFIRTGKIMLYSITTGKRVKEPFSHITWVHTLIINKAKQDQERLIQHPDDPDLSPDNIMLVLNFRLSQCLFGAHLLTEYPDMPVAIVESEKTAVLASIRNRSHLWLAAGSINNLNAQMCQVLKGRTVTLYPDLGAYHKWAEKAHELRRAIPGSNIAVSDLLEKNATDFERQNGWDLGDWL